MFGKRLFGVWVLFTAVILLNVSCATNKKSEIGIVSLHTAIQMAAAEIGGNIRAEQKIALLNFYSPTEAFSEYVLDELESLLARSGKFVIVDRSELDLIRQEENYQRSSDIGDNSAQAIGKKLGAQVIVSGSLNITENIYSIRIMAFNVENAAIVAAPAADIDANEEKTILLLSSIQQEQVPDLAPVIVEDVIKIGDIGPAGGIVFYDKGVFSDGWRYLEAAPVSAEFTAQWSASEDKITGTQNEPGAGRENTRIIVEHLNQKRERDRAAQLCQNLNFGGFNDWFLPNSKELDLMYDNLKLNGFGDFHNRWYWSSSSENDRGDNSWCKSFSNGNPFFISRNQIHAVRAIRAF